MYGRVSIVYRLFLEMFILILFCAPFLVMSDRIQAFPLKVSLVWLVCLQILPLEVSPENEPAKYSSL